MEGGLGVIKLSTHNDALLMKFIHKFYSTFLGCIWSGIITTQTIGYLGSKIKGHSGGEILLN
jgi:hypothetical protein